MHREDRSWFRKRSFQCALCGLHDAITVKTGGAAAAPPITQIAGDLLSSGKWLKATAAEAARNSRGWRGGH
jgi:hypothetical protein